MIEKLKQKFGPDILDVKNPRPARFYIRVKQTRFKEIFSYAINELGFVHLTTISGVDLKDAYELVYHLFGNKAVLSLAFKVSHDNPTLETVTDIIPGAILYERELLEMFGMKVSNIPDDRPLILPDVWPKGQYPLRKDWKQEMLPPSMTEGLRRNWRE